MVMMKKTDSGLSEVVSSVLVLTIVIVAITLIALIALPIMGENEERVHNGDVLIEFANMKADVDTAWLSNNTGVTRQAVFTLSPFGDKTEITMFPNLFGVLSSGTVSLTHGADTFNYGGVTYVPVIITYTASNMYADDIELVYSGEDGGSLSQNSNKILPGSEINGVGSYIIVVKASDEEQSLGGNEIITLEYRLDTIVPYGSDYLCVFDMVLR
jgi:hypothetical protein